MELWPFSCSSEYSMSSSWPRKAHIDMYWPIVASLAHPPRSFRRASICTCRNLKHSPVVISIGDGQCAGLLLSWSLNPTGPIGPVGPVGPVMYQILRLKLVWEVASGWVTSFRAQRTRSNDTQMPPMTYADIITFQYIGHHHILGCQCKSDVLKGHVVPLTRLKPSNSNAWGKIHDVQEQPVMQYKSFA